MSFVKFLDATYLNARGVRLLERGLYDQAIHNFRRAMSLAGGKLQDPSVQARLPPKHPLRRESLFQSLPSTIAASVSTDDSATASNDTIFCSEQEASGNIPLSESCCPSKAHGPAEGFVDETPMKYRPSADASAISEIASQAGSRNSRVTLCVIILYNYALAYHLFASQQRRLGKRGWRQDMQSAIHLYELSCALAYQAGLDLGWGYRLRSANNLGQALMILGETEAAESYFQDLLSCVVFLQQEYGYAPGDDRLFSNDSQSQPVAPSSMERFLENLMPLILRRNPVAPAA